MQFVQAVLKNAAGQQKATARKKEAASRNWEERYRRLQEIKCPLKVFAEV